MSLTLDEVHHLLTFRGGAQYGSEAVTQLDHALQCAHLAESAGEDASLVVAALLHDLGHLLVTDTQPATRDDLHQYLALPFLRRLFPDSVLEPIRLHVDAKRYLCHADPAYREGLSPASQKSLVMQGGVFDAAQAQAFIKQPFALEATRLRTYDDQAKVPGLRVPDLAHYGAHLALMAL